jgi:hypothetical protein
MQIKSTTRKLRICIIAVAIMFAITSCHKSVPKYLTYIPKTAGYVLGFDVKSLADKTEEANVNWDSIVKAHSDHESDSMLDVIKKQVAGIKSAGIDFGQRVYVFVSATGTTMSGKNISAGAIGALKDADKLEAYFKQLMPDGVVKEDKEYKYMALHNDIVAGWNKDAVILSYVKSTGANSPGTYNTGEGTLSQLQLTTLFNEKKSESVVDIKQFEDLVMDKADILYWSNPSSFTGAFGPLALTGLNDLLKDMYSTGKINFENGKVVGESTLYCGKTLSDTLQKYSGPGIDIDAIQKYPVPLQGFIAVSFKPQLIFSLLQAAGVDGFLAPGIASMGFTENDIATALKGSFNIMFSNIHVNVKSNDTSLAKGFNSTGKCLVNIPVGDPASFDKIISKFSQGSILVKDGDVYSLSPSVHSSMALRADSKQILFASDSALMNGFLSGSGNAKLPADILEKVKGKAGAIYVNIGDMIQNISIDSLTDEAKLNAAATFHDMISTIDGYSDHTVKSHMELHTTFANENSLVTILKFCSGNLHSLQKVQAELKRERPSSVEGLTDKPTTRFQE